MPAIMKSKLSVPTAGIFTCCLNVLDFDFAANVKRLLRKVALAMNITVDDPAKSGQHSGDMNHWRVN